MKILMINQADIGGGAEKIAFTLSKELNKRNVKCSLYVDEKKSEEEFVYSLGRSKWQKKTSKLLNKGLNQQSRFCNDNSLLKSTLKEYDIVHIHNLHGNYINLEFLNYIKKCNIPIVWTLHDIWPLTGRCCIEYYCTGFHRACGECKKRLFSYPKMWLDNSRSVLKYKKDILLRNDITFVSPSKFLKTLFNKSFLKEKRIEVINNGINIKEFMFNDKENIKKKYKLNNDKIYILLIAAKLDNKEKGTKEAIEIINKLREKDKVGLITVGNGVSKELIDSKVEVINYGYINDINKLAEIYCICDIFINSTKADNFPTTNMEAMASGTPVFASNIGGNLEQIDSQCGWIFDLNDLEKAAHMLDEIIENPHLIIDKAKNSRVRAQQNYSIESMTEKYIELYGEVLKDNKEKKIESF